MKKYAPLHYVIFFCCWKTQTFSNSLLPSPRYRCKLALLYKIWQYNLQESS